MNGLLTIRKELNLSAATLAKKLDIAKPTISQWEHGVRKIPTERIKQLSEILDIPQDYFGDITEEQVEEVKAIISVNRQEDEHNFEFEEFKQATKELKSVLQQINKTAQEERGNFDFFSDYISSIKNHTKLCTLFADVMKLYGTDAIVKDLFKSLVQSRKITGDNRLELIQSLRREIAIVLNKAEETAKTEKWEEDHKAEFDELF